jgi:hypothetical protein
MRWDSVHAHGRTLRFSISSKRCASEDVLSKSVCNDSL